MKVALLLGSGISYATGLPDVNEITRLMLWEKWYIGSNGNVSRGSPPSKLDVQNNRVPFVQTFLRILRDITGDYFAPRLCRSANYEDLFFLLEQLWAEELGQLNNPVIEPFSKRIKSRVAIEFDTLYFQSKEIKFNDLLFWSRRFIEHALWILLKTERKPEGLDVILELERDKRVDNLYIFTLNNDLIIECLFDDNGIEFAGRFSEQDKNGDRVIEPQKEYSKELGVGLYKLHGSINYWNKQNTDGRFIKCIFNATNDEWKILGNRYHFSGRAPSLLIGTTNKIMSYYESPNFEIHYLFREALNESDVVFESGYSWGDIGINARIFDWLGNNPYRKVIVLHENPERDFNNSADTFLSDNYNDDVTAGKLDFNLRRYLQDISLKDIERFIQ